MENEKGLEVWCDEKGVPIKPRNEPHDGSIVKTFREWKIYFRYKDADGKTKDGSVTQFGYLYDLFNELEKLLGASEFRFDKTDEQKRKEGIAVIHHHS